MKLKKSYFFFHVVIRKKLIFNLCKYIVYINSIQGLFSYTKQLIRMGASSSVDMLIPPHIHISVPVNRESYKNIIVNIQKRLQDIGFIVTLTDDSIDTQAIYTTLRNAHAVIMCNCTNTTSCSTQAIEYSYLVDNYKKTYQVIIDPYNHTFLENIQRILGDEAISVANIDDISYVVKQISENHVVVGA